MKCTNCGKEILYYVYLPEKHANACPYCKTPIGTYVPHIPTTVSGTATGNIKYDTFASPSFTMLVVHLANGQSINAEAGAMMYMSPNIEIKTHAHGGGVLRSLKIAAMGGESFWVNTFSATRGDGDVALVPPHPGDIKPLELAGEGYIVQSGAYLASTAQVVVDTKWQGLKGLLAEGDLVMLYIYGTGTLWLSSFGAIFEKTLLPGETLTVDNGHLVAWPANMPYRVRRIGGMKETLLSGEGLVVDFTGPGKLLLQTRHLPQFVNFLARHLPQR